MQARLGRSDGDGLVTSRREHEHGVERLGDEILPALECRGVRERVAGCAERALGEVADRGYLEPVAKLGSYVKKGDLVARLHDFDRWDEPATEIRADQDGYVMCRKYRAETKQGDVVMVIAKEVLD